MTISLKQKPILTKLRAAVATVYLVFGTMQQASAATLTTGTTFSTFLECLNDGASLVVGQNPTAAMGWQYAVDSGTDGVAGYDVGGNAYEIYSMAVRETTDSIYVAINSNTPYIGNPDPYAQNGTIAFGDLFINFEALSSNFQQASDANSLYAVRFVENNDSGVSDLGLYSNVTAQSVTDINSGFSSIYQYNQHVTDNNGIPSFGDLAADSDYFEVHNSLNEIASGDFLATITFLSEIELTSAGFDWEKAPGQYTVAFMIDKSVLPSDDVISESVPEPDAIASFILLIATLPARRFLKS